jgi:hypothetical protein
MLSQSKTDDSRMLPLGWAIIHVNVQQTEIAATVKSRFVIFIIR